MDFIKNITYWPGITSNRHIHPLPTEETPMRVVSFISGEGEIYECIWKPFGAETVPSPPAPRDGFIGTAIVTRGRYQGFGFHAWEESNHDFVHYQVVNKKGE